MSAERKTPGGGDAIGVERQELREAASPASQSLESAVVSAPASIVDVGAARSAAAAAAAAAGCCRRQEGRTVSAHGLGHEVPRAEPRDQTAFGTFREQTSLMTE